MGLEVIHDPLTLLGRQVEDQAVTSFIAAFSGTLTAEPPDPGLPDRRYFVGEATEIELLADDRNRLQTMFLYLNRYKGHREYRGPLPRGLHTAMTQQEVRQMLGSPQFEREAGEIKDLGRFGRIDRYDFEDCSIHLQYSETHGCIDQVSLAVISAVPERADLQTRMTFIAQLDSIGHDEDGNPHRVDAIRGDQHFMCGDVGCSSSSCARTATSLGA
jgi:hypothetical protein